MTGCFKKAMIQLSWKDEYYGNEGVLSVGGKVVKVANLWRAFGEGAQELFFCLSWDKICWRKNLEMQFS